MTSSTGVDSFRHDGDDRLRAADVQRLTLREQDRFESANEASRIRYGAARTVLAGGVVSSFQLQEPWPVYLDRGLGAAVWDVDGTRRLDFHNGFGAMLQGHAHRGLAEAIARSAAVGAHVGATGDDAVAVAVALRERWGLPAGGSRPPGPRRRRTRFASRARPPVETSW